MKWAVAILTASLLTGCCTKPPPPSDNTPGNTNNVPNPPPTNPPPTPVPTNNPPPPPPSPALPSATEEFDGKKDYRGQQTEFANIWVIHLPNTTGADQVGKITIWANTTKVEGHRVGTNVYCDQIQLVNDDPAHTLIASSDMFRTQIEQATTDTDLVTAGSALGQGDIFTLRDDGSDEFQKLRASLSKAAIFIRLVNKQPNPHPFHVDSAKIEATFSKQ